MEGKGVIIIALLGLLLVVAMCSLSSLSVDKSGTHVGNPVREAQAEATRVAVSIARDNADVDLQIRQADIEKELEAHQVALEATRTAYTAQMTSTLILATVEAGARADVIRTQGQAEANSTAAKGEASAAAYKALAGAAAVSIPIVAVAVGLAALILAIGHSMATVRRAILTSGYVTIGVENKTLLPPPLVIHEGYLIDTRSGERARLRDAAGVDRMRLAAMTHATETALVARSQVAIARTAGSDRPADALMTAVNTLPMIDAGDNGNGGRPV